MAKKKKTWTAEEILKTKAGQKPENREKLESLPKARKRGKYGNTWVEVDGIKFQSKREAKHYQDYQLMLSRGLLEGYKRQVRFTLVDDDETGFTLTYVADHVLTYPGGGKVIVDSKGFETEVFKKKWKLMQKKYPEYKYEIRY